MGLSWPSDDELHRMKKIVAEMSGGKMGNVRVVVSPYRICPLGAHIDHQGGTVSAMTINRGILLAFIPSGDSQVLLRSGQFHGEVKFSVNEVQYPQRDKKINNTEHARVPTDACEDAGWGNYGRGALYALQRNGYQLNTGIVGYVCGSDGLDSSGLSSSAAAENGSSLNAVFAFPASPNSVSSQLEVGVAYLLALESANDLTVSPTENIELDRIIENKYLGLRNGILDQSAILLSSSGCLTCMNCQTKQYKLIPPPKLFKDQYKILLAFSGLKHALTNNPGYNCRVSECQEAARVLLLASGKENLEPRLCNVDPDTYEAHKEKLEEHLARRAEHYFSENMRVTEGLKAWAAGKLEEFGRLISASGLSSIKNYESGCKQLIQLYEILTRAPGVFGARFSGAGFRGCCLAFVDPNHSVEAASFVRHEYQKVQPDWASRLDPNMAVLICEGGDCARVI